MKGEAIFYCQANLRVQEEQIEFRVCFAFKSELASHNECQKKVCEHTQS